jgi:hypothetical protein
VSLFGSGLQAGLQPRDQPQSFSDGWRCLRVVGTLDFGLVGVLASLLVPLADAGFGVFCVSTFDTDCLFVKDADLARATEALRAAGHSVQAGG